MIQANYPNPPEYPGNREQQSYSVQQYCQGYYPAPAPRAPAFEQRRKDPRKCGALRTLNTMGALMIIQTVLTLALQMAAMMFCAAAGVDLNDNPMAEVMMVIGLSPICTALPPLVYMISSRGDWNFHLRFERSSFFGCLLVIFAALGVCMAANLPAALVSDILDELGAKQMDGVLGQEGGGWMNLAVEFLGVAVMVPMLEEFTFRGVMLSALRRYGTGFAIAASSLIFGMAHMQLSSVVFASIAGVAMGTAYVLTGNLWVCVCIHGLNNGIAVIESYYYLFMGWGEEKKNLLSGATMLILCALGVLALVLLMVLRRRIFPRKEPMVPEDGRLYQPLRAGESAVTMLKSVVLWTIVAMVMLETAMLFIIA